MSNEISLDELLSEQSKVLFLATIEEHPEDTEKVKVTPWTQGGGCLCHSSVILPKDVIKSVKPTNDRHHCCGKVLLVVEVFFKEDATIPVSELFNQLGQAVHHSENHSHPFDSREATLGASQTNSPISQMSMYSQPYGYSEPYSTPDTTIACQPPNQEILCAGRFWCVPPGSTCCHDMVCTPPNNQCMLCAGKFWCVPSGSTCCLDRPCTPPYSVCMQCAGKFVCVAPGSTCCHDKICPPGTRCVQEGGQFVCR